MESSPFKSPLPPPFFTRPAKFANSTVSTWNPPKPRKQNPEKSVLPKCRIITSDDPKPNTRDGKANSLSSGLVMAEIPVTVKSSRVAEKLHLLDSEFKSLPEPIERVKRLLHYATLLPPFDESRRVQDNRITGCTTHVWLEVEMEEDQSMIFGADSDSEITKGFCSCLIWLLDGGTPAEVLAVRAEDLAEINVGLQGTSRSRVNTWHNILISMQKRTQDLISRVPSPAAEPWLRL